MDVVLLALTTLSLAAAAGFGALSWRVGREERERSRARIAALSTAMAPPSPSPAPPAREVPEIEEGRLAVGSVFNRFVAVGVTALAILIVTLVAFRGHAPARPAAGSAPAPLELMSMRNQHDATTLTVSGLVRNPPAGARVNGVTAVVFAFDRKGGFIASGRSPLDFSALAPGDESPFVVTVPNASDVARYRVSFRTDAGVVRHVDRRSAPVLALR